MRRTSIRKAVAWALAGSIAAFGTVIGAPGGNGGGGGGGGGSGGKPDVELQNNLSYPIMELNSAGATASDAITAVQAGEFGVNFSYGCVETDPAAEYPNRTCASESGDFYDKADTACTSICEGQPIQRMYWQKVNGQSWKSQQIGGTPDTPNALAAYVDWGDALESRTSAETSVIRVETMPFYDSVTPALKGFDMWHVFGLGKTEMWGARVTDEPSDLQHYTYATQYAIVHTSQARLNLAKLNVTAESCPSFASEFGASPYDGVFGAEDPMESAPVWDGSTRTWNQAVYTNDMPFSAELNIQGKYVYGYNWQLKTMPVTGAEKAGWWRVTFYAPDVHFDGLTGVGAPVVPESAPDSEFPLIVPTVLAEDDSDTDTDFRLYKAVVSPAYDLTFIDVCISTKKGGGRKK